MHLILRVIGILVGWVPVPCLNKFHLQIEYRPFVIKAK